MPSRTMNSGLALARRWRGETAGQEAAAGEGEQDQPGLERGVADDVLQPQRQREDDAELAEAHDRRGDVAVAERL